MYKQQIEKLLAAVRDGSVSVEEGAERLKSLPFEDLGFARLDHHRALRRGFPEVVYCQDKQPGEVLDIITRMSAQNHVFATRVSNAIFTAIQPEFPAAQYNDLAQTLFIRNHNVPLPPAKPGKVAVASAGTSDLPVAEEAAITAEVMGNPVQRIFDVGVAGLHRVLAERARLEAARVLIVVAGMDGALPSVVSGLVDRPVIAVPTSVGYGASFRGIGPLLTMLNACSPGVTVVNIDNGFGAGYFASLINQ